jgi:hypothetical protein
MCFFLKPGRRGGKIARPCARCKQWLQFVPLFALSAILKSALIGDAGQPVAIAKPCACGTRMSGPGN